MMSVKDFNNKQIVFVNGRKGEKFAFSNDNLVIKDEEGEIIHQSTCYQLFSLYIIGHFVITLKLIEKAKKFGFSIVLMSYSFRLVETINCGLQGNYLLHQKQYFNQNEEIGKLIIMNKIKNQIVQLKNRRDHSLAKLVNEMDELLIELGAQNEFYSIMSIEGLAAKKYFKSLFKDYDWIGRKPRTKIDPINTVLDIGYTLLFNFIESLIDLYDFDAYIGVFHKQFYKRKSLVCDLIEPFRVIIDDATIKAFNLKQFKYEDFAIYNDQSVLKIKLASKYANVYLEAIIDNKNEIFKYIQSYYRWFMKSQDNSLFPHYEWRRKW